ncbi:radical SAM protein [Paraburkholderia sp. RL18-085-BIA-A]|uniref:radical SAM protein n=1 Tax=Paraburkholderia sp. RL18-085-BIA-A TaxID=3031633 RepID=UPI0038B92311
MKSRSGPDGVHIFDRRTGLNILFDEVSVDQPKWATAPRQVSVALTNLCDLNCSYCYAPKHRAALATEKVLSWLEELDSEGCLGVGFGGGEPTLHPDFPETPTTTSGTWSLISQRNCATWICTICGPSW